MELKGKTIVVVGAGASGLAAARLCHSKGAAKVALNDRRSFEELRPALAGYPYLELRLGAHDATTFADADLVVVSPGVPPLSAFAECERRGVEVIAEVELAARYLRGALIGITGTNGKSTVTSLVGAIMRETGVPTFVGANLGEPLSNAVGTEAGERGAIVAELSSFQLERVRTLRPKVAVLLNISPDHLDRYPSFQAYAEAKANIFGAQRESDHAVVPSGDSLTRGLVPAGLETHLFGGLDGEVRIAGDALLDTVTGLRFPLERLAIQGRHNAENAAAAVLTARLAGASRDAIERALIAFRGLGHRAVVVRELDGVRYVDDSKATNVGAAIAALDGFASSTQRAVLIAGGVDKGGSYEPLVARMREVGRAVITIGQAAPLIEQAFDGAPLPVERANDMADAVERARRHAQRGDLVLLAPACSSFDMFTSYAHRGDVFVAAVRALEGGR